ncbi:hypothetical protein E8D34_03790 [Nocardioides sp. GY 10113]|uniref:hypothetical protein n=1 Tax=Nocardioides sp. GY 10113 TaxID=2569761 RepID=UPI0010A7A39D|nr:hypothetical protein [Nocardioides sp. GY 10113]TIC88791.1 hypothetical protein E8D34_03790 [Nocardioides sp. GY 10113]
MSDGHDHLSRGEIAKDALQAGAQATAHTVGEVTSIVTRAVGEVAAAVGGLATELFAIRDDVRRAAADQDGGTGGVQDGGGQGGDQGAV